jgi:hypothetical protein
LGATILFLENDKAIPLEFIRAAVHLPGKHSSNLARFRRTASVPIAQWTYSRHPARGILQVRR